MDFNGIHCGGIIKEDTINGPGMRTSIFISGCINRCKNCFNKELWDPKYGREFNQELFNEIMEAVSSPLIRGITLLGGDPLYYKNVIGVGKFIKEYKKYLKENNMLDKDNIIIYTGYKLENLVGRRRYRLYLLEILKNSDILIDGKFEESLKDLNLKFRGSSNQRIIDLKRSFKEDKIIIIPDEEL